MSCVMVETVAEPVRQLLREHVETHEQLQILIGVIENGDRSSTADTLATQFQLPVATAIEALAHLEADGVIEPVRRDAAEPIHYRYALDLTLGELLRSAYRTRPVDIMSLMTANAIERVRMSARRTFTPASWLRKRPMRS